MSTLITRAALMTGAALASLTLVACGSEDSTSRGDTTGGSSTQQSQANGRAFDSTNDAVITAITAATKANQVSWDGKKLMVRFDTGSANDPTAAINCLAIQSLIAKDEAGIIVYSDGQIDCSER